MEHKKEKKDIGETWKKVFEDQENSYQGFAFTKFQYFKFKRSYINRTVRNICKPLRGKKAMEAGCASGKMSIYLASLGCEVDALDISSRMLENVKDLVKKSEKDFGTLKVNPVLGDITDMEYKDGIFDLVINEGVVEHWLDKKERVDVITEMARVTKKGGHVVIIVPNGAHPYTKRWLKHFGGYRAAPPMTLYSAKKLKREMEESGLKVVKYDGSAAWRSLNQHPNLGKAVGYMLLFLDFVLPSTSKFRQKWGINVFAIGEKK